MLILTITKDDPITIGNTTIHLKDGAKCAWLSTRRGKFRFCGEEQRSGQGGGVICVRTASC